MRTGIILIATAFVLVGMPAALADESAPDCEANQPWIGYRTTSAVRDSYNEDFGQPAGLNTCEGEQWDGQDSVQADQPGSCAGSVNAVPTDLHVGLCSSPDINTMSGDDPINPLGLRVSSANANSVYVGTNIVLVGRAAVYADESTAAVYIRDNTPGNVLATVISAPRVTQGHVSEADCDQATYQAGAFDGTAACGRDNTAITVEHGLLA